MKKIIYILSTCAIVAVIVVILIFNKRTTAQKTGMVADSSAAVAVKMEVIKDSAYTIGFSSNGLLEAARDLSFLSDAAGRIVNIYADEGSPVRKGQVLIQLDNEMLLADFKSNEAAYYAIKKDYERFEKANTMDGVSDQQLDNIRTQMIAAESRYISSKRRLADASIKAPVSGTVYKRYVEVGSFVNPGAKLFDIIDDSQLRVMCYVTEKQVLSISKGQLVEVRCETFPGETFTGKIIFIGEKADRSLNFPVKITMMNNKNELKSGMYVNVSFGSDTEKNGILISRSAISGSVQQADVFVVKNGIAKKQKVITGSMRGKWIEIVQGLQPGDSIVVAGLINISDGAKVKDIQ
ncbi:MAG: efflux RND transporter periplasmic adaptor subunit [Paludibacter sp.]|nr:efflux RND transporter periplasmic adaptor subunit [Paludibacter sp.]